MASKSLPETRNVVQDETLSALVDTPAKTGSNTNVTFSAFLSNPDTVTCDSPTELCSVLEAIEVAVKRIGLQISRAGIDRMTGLYEEGKEAMAAGRDKQKKLDVVANQILTNELIQSRQVAVLASEEDDEPVWISNDGPYVVVFDPLDGSRNIDASIPTGTIFGVYERNLDADILSTTERSLANVLRPGSQQVAAGYALYSSATMLVVTLGKGTHGFTLDSFTQEFVLTHPGIQIPQRGQIYSVNDARYFDWPQGLRNYIDTVRQGKGQNPKQYSARYICSLVADFHRTLLYGGIAMNPRDHLRLLYEANPLSFVSEQAGGKGVDGKRRILDIEPVKVHQRLPLFLGSPDDIDELMSYEDIQQLKNPGYEV